MKINIIKKTDIPAPPKTISQGIHKLKDGTTISNVIVDMHTPPVSSTYTQGFAKLKDTKYYPLFKGWYVSITK